MDIVIYIKGGCVSSVSSDTSDVSVEVVDYDIDRYEFAKKFNLNLNDKFYLDKFNNLMKQKYPYEVY